MQWIIRLFFLLKNCVGGFTSEWNWKREHRSEGGSCVMHWGKGAMDFCRRTAYHSPGFLPAVLLSLMPEFIGQPSSKPGGFKSPARQSAALLFVDFALSFTSWQHIKARHVLLSNARVIVIGFCLASSAR